ncbi:hypothetical protein TTHERM_00394650 (macronuclear) [Tetrahymena thermophila SB210]|uniref:Uncharacterized protein n=1 Tax=Tetrahymena thermophila (strain SB210) TaxID=312017 RepID=Q232Y8_TETTS|nr:hypothetical protein TTHERM_00394650 [Tetrahymena thermophila SB210]EAR91692.1 hypothetical protein TTHERM_00394650 [Tetrahymena thermophila SB210]|eukprot:XP_001011937.1 hypothetical protein TTHERM_00394650 [Tetrahymena thermophila SB210]
MDQQLRNSPSELNLDSININDEKYKINQTDLIEMKEKFDQFSKLGNYYSKNDIVNQFKRSLICLSNAQQNQQRFLQVINSQESKFQAKQKGLEQEYQRQISQLKGVIQNQNEQIKNLQEKSQTDNNNLQQQLDEKQVTIINQQNQYEMKLQEQKNSFDQIINEHKKQIDSLTSQNKDLNQYKSKYEEVQSELENYKSNQNKQEQVKKIFQEFSVDSNQPGDIDKQVQQVLELLNPQVEISTNLVEFTKAHQIILQNQPSEEEKISLQAKNDELVQMYNDNYKKAQQSLNCIGESMKCLLALQNMYLQDGIQTFLTDQPIQNLEKEQNYQIQQSFLQVGLHNQASYYSAIINSHSYLYQNLVETKAKESVNEFLVKFKEQIGQMVNSDNPKQDITIVKISFDQQPQVDFQVVSKQFNHQEIKKKISLQDIGMSFSEKSLLEGAKLSVDMFDPQFNMEWGKNFQGQSTKRGQLTLFDQVNPVDHLYYFPVGYKGYALNIDRYGYDKSWISSNSDSKTWIVLYHGTKEKAVENITKNNLIAGQNNAYGGTTCRITNTKIKQGPNANIYLTDDLAVAEEYAVATSAHDGKKYHVIFQCRVNPQGVKSPKLKPSYYTVEDNLNIRPYRILLKECKQ